MTNYDRKYFETDNYRNYTRGYYRAWHWVKFFWIGMWLRIMGIRTTLDFGCADGVSVAAFRFWGIEAWGIDVSQYAIDMAPAWVKKYLKVGDLRSVKFPVKKFDCLVSWDVMEHLPPNLVVPTLTKFKLIAKRGLMGIYVLDETVAKIHTAIGKKHPDHLSEFRSKWWEQRFVDLHLKYWHVPLSRKGTYWVKL